MTYTSQDSRGHEVINRNTVKLFPKIVTIVSLVSNHVAVRCQFKHTEFAAQTKGNGVRFPLARPWPLFLSTTLSTYSILYSLWRFFCNVLKIRPQENRLRRPAEQGSHHRTSNCLATCAINFARNGYAIEEL
jgi:hypothetical protein